MSIKLFVLTALLVVSFIFATSCTQGTQIAFETVEKDVRSAHSEQKEYVINNQNEWIELWNKTVAGRRPQPKLPYIDFSNTTIIAVYQGTKRSTGYTIEITKIVETENQFIVHVKESKPSGLGAVGAAMTNPYHIIKTKKITKEIIFKK